MEGPRPLLKDEMQEVADLVSRPLGQTGLGAVMPHNPQIFNERNLENLLVIREDGRIVTHVGHVRFTVNVAGCLLKAGCLGGVHTHEDYRKRGFATKALLASMERFRDGGGDFLVISGRRGLYFRNHAVIVGRGSRFIATRDGAGGFADGRMRVREWKGGDVAALARVHRAEPVRIMRPPETWRFFEETRACHFAPCPVFVVECGGEVIAYLIVRGEKRDGRVEVLEFAGDRHGVCAALPGIIEAAGAEAAVIAPRSWDRCLIKLLESARFESEPEAADGTIVILDYERLFERLQPRFSELLGGDRPGVEADGERVVFRAGGDELAVDADTATRLIFGTPEGEEKAVLEGSTAGRVLEEVFPVPLPIYGINYV